MQKGDAWEADHASFIAKFDEGKLRPKLCTFKHTLTKFLKDDDDTKLRDYLMKYVNLTDFNGNLN